ncbi:dual specificity protein kinase splB-like [Sycon ciliatum]|uniref:dual specificity protein kinase splB-like n=1 Tax=Sycon ciliatum TaxID=27933 RepID=UPI0031F615A1
MALVRQLGFVLAILQMYCLHQCMGSDDNTSSGGMCVTNVFMISNATAYNRISNCTTLLGSLEMINYTPPEGETLSLRILTGYLRLNLVNAPTFRSIFPNLTAVMGLRRWPANNCAITISSTYLGYEDISVQQKDIDAEELERCQYNNPYGENKTTIIRLEENDTLTLESLFQKADGSCPELQFKTKNKDKQISGQQSQKCSNAYNCSSFGRKYTHQEQDLPCWQVCNTITVSSPQSLCEVSKGCVEINGNLELLLDENFASQMVSSCLKQSDTPQAALESYFKDLENITGRLIVFRGAGLTSLDFLKSLKSILGENSSYYEGFYSAPTVSIIDTSLQSVARLNGRVVIGGTQKAVIHSNPYLCGDISSLCNTSDPKCRNNGYLSFCNPSSASILNRSILSWDPFNNTQYKNPVYRLLAREVDDETELKDGSNVCTRIDSDSGWMSLDYTDKHQEDLEEFSPSQLKACKEYEFVICTYAKSDDTVIPNGVEWAWADGTYTVPGNMSDVEVNIAINISDCDPAVSNFTVKVDLQGDKRGDIKDFWFDYSIYPFRNKTRFTVQNPVSILACTANTTVNLTHNASNITLHNGTIVVKAGINFKGSIYFSTTLGVVNLVCHNAKNISKKDNNDTKNGTNNYTKNGIWKIPTAITVPIGAGLVISVVYLLYKRRVDKRKLREAMKLQTSLRSDYDMPFDLEGYDEDPTWELVADSIELVEEIGEGAFGKVFKGILSTVEDGDLTVAVKTLTQCENVAERNAFLMEASIMKKFDSPYVMKLMGLVTTTAKPLVVMEYMEVGDLRAYLIMCRPEEQQFFNRAASSAHDVPSVELFATWATQLARGMVHLNEKHFVHRDLAARNCMLASDLSLKIGDFGLTRDIYESDYYRKLGRGALPVRWMGPESLRDGVYVTASDVWSYGIVLWEMATLGDQPYQGKSHEEVITFVKNGGHMDAPIVLHPYPDSLYEVMQKCWAFVPADRPGFEVILEMLEDKSNEAQQRPVSVEV